eukprot:TRINITY_DN3229_c0_g1_i1.p1 TRINITY_DN3229_c0_g1~~TRINITY_DN3229_c0_g1_i1.p1  ORF type:complete len:251 (+),score=59.41 TRINITY_DN3229_c0_g1_i1:223-975(+)
MESETIINNGSDVVESDGVDLMAANGITKKDRDVEEKDDGEILDLNRKIEALESQKLGLVAENKEMKKEIELLSQEIEGYKKTQAETKESLEEMEKRIDRFEENKAALKAIAARAAELEKDVSGLQHELLSATSANHESEEEIKRLKKSMEELNREKDSTIEELVQKIERAEGEEKKSENERIKMVEETLKRSEEKFKESELEVNRLKNEVETMMKSNGFKVAWPTAAAAATGTVAAAVAMFYVKYAKRR